MGTSWRRMGRQADAVDGATTGKEKKYPQFTAKRWSGWG